MTETTNEVVAAVAKTPVEIIRGRMPVAIVYLARCGNMKADSTKVKADKFGTTVGKIDDIAKNRNFAYVTETFRPTDEQKKQGFDWLKRHPSYDAQNVDTLVNELDAIPVATPEEAAAFEAARAGARGQNAVTKEGETANAGGGNQRKSKKAAKADAEADASALLA